MSFLWEGITGLTVEKTSRLTTKSPHKSLALTPILRTLSNDDDGSENVGKKINLRSFKFNRVYVDPLNMSNADDFSWSWILKDFIQKEEGETVVVCPRPEDSRRSRAVRGR